MNSIFSRSLAALFCAAFFFAAAPSRAGAEDLDCLWSQLTTAERTRLELAARIGDSPPKALLDRWGEAALAEHFLRCRIAFERVPMERAARYLSSRSKSEVLFAALVAGGVDGAEALATLEAEAPPERRRGLAEEIMQLEQGSGVGPAATVVRAVAARIEGSVTPKGGTGLALIGAEWATARILADGLETGAEPPAR